MRSQMGAFAVGGNDMAASQGNCFLCGKTFGKTAMKNHAIREHSAGDEVCWLLKAESAWDKNYWLYFTVPKDAALACVDKFLRQIWLECCGHLSAFRLGGREFGKNRKLGGFAPGDTLLHEYDFGSTTETLLTFVAETARPTQKEKVRLLARNEPPKYPCDKCGKAAVWVNCWEDGDLMCEACASRYEEGLLPLVNSPRCGECGYDGEQDRWTFDPAKIAPSSAATKPMQQTKQSRNEINTAEPTIEQWKELHEAAQGIKAMAPWEYLRDEDFITIQLPGRDEPVYCSVMGAGGECFGVGMYSGNEAITRLLRTIQAPEGEPPFVHMFMQTCVNCYFGDREELGNEERALLKELDIKYRGRGQWIYFRSHREGFDAQPLNRNDAALVIDTLQNLYMALRAYLEGRLEVDFEKGETLLRWRDKKKKDQWYCAAAPWPEELPFAVETYTINDEEFLAEMNAAKKTRQVLELDWFYFPFTMSALFSSLVRSKEVSRYPLCFCVADADAGRAVYRKMLDKDDDPVDFALDFLEAWIQKNGRPAQVLTRSVMTGIHLLDFCKKTDIALEMEGTPIIDGSLLEMASQLNDMFDPSDTDQ